MTGSIPVYSISPETDSKLDDGLHIISQIYPNRFSAAGKSVVFTEDSNCPGLQIYREKDSIKVHYAQPCHAFRALGILLSKSEVPDTGGIVESCAFSRLGVMLDVSRNAVLRIESLETLFVYFALMGINSVQLYMEDVYTLDEEPYFGYCRGAYSPDELRRIDSCGTKLGIEVVPCIQTLGHFEQVLQWPAYRDIIDVPDVLLVGEEKTYRLIEKILDAVSKNFSTKRVHIGMDEAFGVALGRYRRLHGDVRPFDVLNEHLTKVAALCEKRELRPMMWSDMYFRIGSATNEYYDRNSKIPEDVAPNISPLVDLVYWDYYHGDSAFYEEWIDRHRSLGKEPIFATGAWNWGTFWTRLPFAFSKIAPGMKAAKSKNLQESIITLWGDDGTECDPFSTLPAVQFFAESAYHSDVTNVHLEARFFGSCGAELAPLLEGSMIDVSPDEKNREADTNFGKWILWHDPILNFLEKCIPEGMVEHYRQIACSLNSLQPSDTSAPHVRFAALLASTLHTKTALHVNMRALYREGNVEGLRALASETLPQTIISINKLWSHHRQIWSSWYKPFGWEVIDRRYGGILARLESLRQLLDHYLKNPNTPIPEFELETLDVHRYGSFTHARTSYPTVIR